MRSVKVKHVHVLGPTLTLEVETEELLQDDDDAARAGREANAVLRAVVDAIADAGEEMD